MFSLNGYTGYFTSQGRGKGMAIYIKDGENIDIQSITTPSLQMTKLSCGDTLDIITMYRSQEESFVSVVNHLQIMVDQEKNTLIVGDINFDYLQKSNALVTYLTAGRFKQLVANPTHISGGKLFSNFSFTLHYILFIHHNKCHPSVLGLLDQAHFRQVHGKEQIAVEQNTNYYSDHDTLTVILQR